MGPRGDYDGGWDYGWIWGLIHLLFWIALIGLAVWAVLRLTKMRPKHFPPGFPPGPHRHGFPESPREVLDRRFAAGEIDAPTYEAMRARIEAPGPQPAPPAPQPAPPAAAPPAPQSPTAPPAEPPSSEEQTKRL